MGIKCLSLFFIDEVAKYRQYDENGDEVLGEYGVAYRSAGENIARGQSSPEEVVRAWMNSEGHRANILGESFTSLGVGVYKSGGTYAWTQLFIS